MKQRLVLSLFILLLTASCSLYAADQTNIYSFVNKRLLISDGFAGQVITLIKEPGGYFILRDFLGSGVAVVATVKYSVVFESEYQISFSKIVAGQRPYLTKNIQEHFTLAINNHNEPQLYLNGIRIVISEIIP